MPPRPPGAAATPWSSTPAYVDVAVLRWQALTGEEAVLEADGRSFREVAEERDP